MAVMSTQSNARYFVKATLGTASILFIVGQSDARELVPSKQYSYEYTVDTTRPEERPYRLQHEVMTRFRGNINFEPLISMPVKSMWWWI